MPFNTLGPNATLMDFVRERSNDAACIANIEQNMLQGRTRNSGAVARATPSSPSDVIRGDAAGDIVNDGTYIYELINVTGVGLRWHRVSINVAW